VKDYRDNFDLDYLSVLKNWDDFLGSDVIDWKTTPGVGDFMYGLNIAHMRAFVNQKPTTIRMHWYHPEDYYYHFEDPETIVERCDYIKKFYMWNYTVNVEHVFDSQDMALYKKRYYNVTTNRFFLKNSWTFNIELDTSPVDKKIIMWIPTFNADAPREFKNPYDPSSWVILSESLQNSGYQVVNIDYRTPISEVFYHIRTCELCISYEGMWHYVARNFFKPHIVISDQGITRWHTPSALQLDPSESVYSLLNKFLLYRYQALTYSRRYKHKFFTFIGAK